MILVSCSAALGEDGPHAGVSDVHLHHELMSRVGRLPDADMAVGVLKVQFCSNAGVTQRLVGWIDQR